MNDLSSIDFSSLSSTYTVLGVGDPSQFEGAENGSIVFDPSSSDTRILVDNNWLPFPCYDTCTGPLEPSHKLIHKHQKCPSCGAPVDIKKEVCPYCDTPYIYEFV